MNRFRLALFASLLTMAVPCFANGPVYTAKFLYPADGHCAGRSQEIRLDVMGPTPPPAIQIVVRLEDGRPIYDEVWYGTPPSPISIAFEPKKYVPPLPDGIHSLSLEVVVQGEIVARDQLTLRVDTVAPTVRLLQPVQNEVVTGYVWIEGEMYDNYTGPGEWWLYINDSRRPIKKGFGPNIEFLWDTTGIPAGSKHRIRIVGFDQCGNATATPWVECIIAATIRGKVGLGQYFGSPKNKSMRVTLKDGNQVVEVLETTLDPEGNYSVVSKQIGSFTILTKPAHWLQIGWGSRRLDGVTHLDPVHPINGDANLDNRINMQDINQLLIHFGTPTWRSDIDGSGLVDIYDLNILCLNFGLVGEN